MKAGRVLRALGEYPGASTSLAAHLAELDLAVTARVLRRLARRGRVRQTFNGLWYEWWPR